ncbi:MAG: mandelate racemase/muconate lactonizing enzyme family protein [Beutenbergiaceae bacterium]
MNQLRATVRSVRPILLSHTYAPGEELSWVGGTIRSWDAALVEVTLTDGSTGLGEAGAGIMAAQAVPGIVDALRPYLDGVEFENPQAVGDHLRAYTAFWSRGGLLSGVIGAVETAILDAVGKRENAPAWQLLGGDGRPSIEAYASGGLGTTFDDISAWATQQHKSGFGTVKFRAMRDPGTTIELLHHVTSHLPEGTQFIIDAVQACASNPWPVEQAIEVGQVAAQLGARWYEEPCQAEDVAGLARVRAAVDVPISGVESNAMVREFAELVANQALDILQPDVSFVGGPTAFRRVAALAQAAGLQCVPHVWGSGVTFAANLHTVAATASVNLFEFCTLPNPLREALLLEPPRLVDGQVQIGRGAGLGVAVTAEIQAQFPFTAGGGHVIR